MSRPRTTRELARTACRTPRGCRRTGSVAALSRGSIRLRSLSCLPHGRRKSNSKDEARPYRPTKRRPRKAHPGDDFDHGPGMLRFIDSEGGKAPRPASRSSSQAHSGFYRQIPRLSSHRRSAKNVSQGPSEIGQGQRLCAFTYARFEGSAQPRSHASNVPRPCQNRATVHGDRSRPDRTLEHGGRPMEERSLASQISVRICSAMGQNRSKHQPTLARGRLSFDPTARTTGVVEGLSPRFYSRARCQSS